MTAILLLAAGRSSLQCIGCATEEVRGLKCRFDGQFALTHGGEVMQVLTTNSGA